MSPAQLRFWGVRGGVPTPGPDFAAYGGNTSCVELRCGPHLIVFDAGTGLRALGADLLAANRALDMDILCTHTHLDHISGLPYFAPLFLPEANVRLRAGHLTAPQTLRSVVGALLDHPFNPNLMSITRAALTFIDFTPGATFELAPGLSVSTAKLRHPGEAVGFRVEWSGRSVAYITDTEHAPGRPDANVLRLAAEADVMIYDASYTDAEYPDHVGWGHSTWEEGVRLANLSGARRLVLFHHDSSHDDAMMNEIAAAAAAARPGTLAALEGMQIEF